MSKSLKLDDNNNLVFAENFILIDDIESLAQDVTNKLDLWKGEFIYNTEIGLDYLEMLRYNNLDLLKSEIEDYISQDERVESTVIAEFRENEDGKIEFRSKITTKEGEVLYV